MRRAATRLVALATATVLVSACGPVDRPDRPADAVGTAAAVETRDGAVRVDFSHDPGYEYYEGTVFAIDPDQLDAGIEPGHRLQVWTGACEESFPVRCEVEAVEVLDLSP